jgi:NAD+ kinase
LLTLGLPPAQVVFDPQNTHRRKSSLGTADIAAHLNQRRKDSECYVHALLESQRRSGGSSGSGLEGIAESLAEPTIAEVLDTNSDTDATVEPRTGTSEDTVCQGQEDQRAWRERIEANRRHPRSSAADDEQIQSYQAEEDAVHSRLLTKKQLSDMAWGVRELSKRLGSIRLKLKVKTVFILTKAHDETLIGNTREVTRWLLSPERDVRYTVYVEENLRDNKKFNAQELIQDLEESYSRDGKVNEGKKVDRRLKYWTNEMCRARPHNFDFVVTLGGDGTVLYASWLFQRIVPPVLSFALGSLGFLTMFDYEDFRDTLTKSFKYGVSISLRLRFEGTIMRSQKRKNAEMDNATGNYDEEPDSNETRDLVEELVGEEQGDERTHRPDGTYEILNDIVVDRGPNPSKQFILVA